MARKHTKKDFPMIEKEKLVDYASAKSGVDRKLALAVIEAYLEGIYQALSSGTQVALSNVGVLTFRVHEPRPEGMYWNGFAKEYQPFANRQGYYYLDIAPYPEFKSRLKHNTLFGERPTLDEYNEALIARHGDKAELKEKL
jgi:hypothetical protein